MTVNPAPITINAEAEAAICAWMRGRVNDEMTGRFIVGAIDAATTTIETDNGVGLRPKALLIDSEVVEVTARTGNVLTVSRGMLGTVAETHGAGAKISVLKYANVKELCYILLVGKLREILAILSPPAIVLTQRKARKAAEDAEKAALDAAVA